MKFISYATVLSLLLTVNSCKRDIPSPKANELSCSDIYSSTVLIDRFTDPENADYIVSCTINVQGMLTISPGVVIEFVPGAGFNVSSSGSINAVATGDKPIIFKGSTDTPGSWKGLNFDSYSDNNRLSFVTITGGGSQSFKSDNILANIRLGALAYIQMDNCTISKSLGDGLYAEGSSISGNNPISNFTANTFNDNAVYPLNIDPASLSVMDATTSFTANGKQFICLRGTEIQIDQQWNALQAPYLVDGTMTINATTFTNGSVTVNPGTQLVFAPGAGIVVSNYGYLKLAGSSSKRITVTGETPTAGSWKGINYQTNTTSNKIDYADISYGGCCSFTTTTADAANIVLGGNSTGRVAITNSSINYSANCGIKVKTGSILAQQTAVTFTGNASGNVCN